MIGSVEDVRFDLTGFDAAVSQTFYVCPICGSVLDSDDDFVLVDNEGDPASAADVAGCSRCLKKISAERMEQYGVGI